MAEIVKTKVGKVGLLAEPDEPLIDGLACLMCRVFPSTQSQVIPQISEARRPSQTASNTGSSMGVPWAVWTMVSISVSVGICTS